MDKECENCARQCSHGGHCIGKNTPECNEYVQYVPKIRIEKQVWESTLNHSMKLQAENEALKERLSKLEKMQYSYTPEEWNAMLRTVNRTSEENAQLKELLKECRKEVDSEYEQLCRINDVYEAKNPTGYWQLESAKVGLKRILTKIDEVLDA